MTTSPLCPPPAFIGDLSTQDAAVLATMARGARVLEFGVGGSTQIFASVSAQLVSMETEGGWITRTIQNLQRLGIDGSPLRFMHYDLSALKGTGPYDLVFVDGEPGKRETFALAAFDELAADGLMVFHDSRTHERSTVLRVALTHVVRVGEIHFEIAGSNLAAIRKRTMPEYENWNTREGREPWEYAGHQDPPADFVSRIHTRTANFFEPYSNVPVPRKQES